MIYDKKSSVKKDKEGAETARNIGLSTCLIGLIVALANPSLVGLSGVADGLFIGAGTGVGAAVCGFVAGIAAGVFIAATSIVVRRVIINKIKAVDKRKKFVDVTSSILATGMVVSAAIGYVGGGIGGYKLSKDLIVDKKVLDKGIQELFNKSSSPKNVEIDRNNFKATIKSTSKPSL